MLTKMKKIYKYALITCCCLVVLGFAIKIHEQQQIHKAAELIEEGYEEQSIEMVKKWLDKIFNDPKNWGVKIVSGPDAGTMVTEEYCADVQEFYENGDIEKIMEYEKGLDYTVSYVYIGDRPENVEEFFKQQFED